MTDVVQVKNVENENGDLVQTMDSNEKITIRDADGNETVLSDSEDIAALLDMIGGTVQTMSKEEREKERKRVALCRSWLLYKHPFIGQILLHMPLVEDESIGTQAVDGFYHYYSPFFSKKLTDSALTFVVVHEAVHLIADHLGRWGDFDKDEWQAATDYIANEYSYKISVKKHDSGQWTDHLEIPKEIAYFDEKYFGWTAEEIYYDLKKNGFKKKSGVDNHGRAWPSEEAVKRVRDIVQKAAGASNGAVPAELQGFINDLLKPKVTWKTYLRQSLSHLMTKENTWRRPDRRFIGMNQFLPGRDKGYMVEVDVWIDSSGSTAAYRQRFISELVGIGQQFDDIKFRVLSWDTAVHNVQFYTTSNLGKMRNYETMGNGGTLVNCAFEYDALNPTTSKTIVILTDGELFDTPKRDKGGKNVVWVVCGNPTFQAPYGKVIHIQD